MRSLRKISPSPYADSTHSVMAYSGDGLGFEVAEPDATYVAPQVPEEPVDPRQAAIDEAHSDAAVSVGLYAGASAGTAYAVTGEPRIAAAYGLVMGVARTYHTCYLSCHDQNPPVEPPEIETGEEEEEEEKDK